MSPGAAYLQAFLGHLASERRLSPLTCSNYGRDVTELLRLAGETPLDQLQVHQIRRFIAQLHGRGLGGKTLARMLSAWRGFYAWLARDHGFASNPCAGMRAPKSVKALPQALSPDEAARLMEIPVDGDPLALRDKAMFELFYSSGLRLSELVNLPLSQIDLAAGMVRVTGKGSKTREVPVGRFALEAVRNWLPEREKLARPEEYALFVGKNGARLTPRAVQYRVKQWALKLGISAEVHPHVLRHSFASHVLQSSGDLRAVQEMLGHANISTTQVYTHLDFQHLAKVYDAAHPRAKKKP
ncbi:tyrosine recombinase XerC [Sulfuricella sp. T08]|uniref:tyrosine recombinase XerC n=1 Tax=Sulfuricella sp. T08 TaxID=1632857 RepID=UPI0006179DB4|nr:tyrosine recombinase XerC [Sulfuricella sp. T08]GAO37214.1 tyrosine recombinase XerC [Sulfuricella sp. T08]